MLWFTWRQYRIHTLLFSIIVLFMTVVLLITGLRIAAFAQNIGLFNCTTINDQCLNAGNNIQLYIDNNAFGSFLLYNYFIFAFLLLPAFIGMFIGVPVMARELEQGTYRLAWTQSISWSRWLWTKISTLMLCTLGITIIFYCLFYWWKVPVEASELPTNLWVTIDYDIWGIPAIAYALFALVLGVCAGTILRKTVPAMLITFILFIAIRILIEVYWRPYFLPPVVVTKPLAADTQPPQSAWSLSRSESYASGKPLPSYISGDLKDVPLAQLCTELTDFQPNEPLTPARIQARNQCEVDGKDGFLSTHVYQPGDRLWLFQEIECGIYLLMSTILLALTFWWTKHRILGARN